MIFEPDIHNILVVMDFPNIFPSDLPSMTPEREIEFSMDLLPSIATIFKTSYQMGWAELQELGN